MSHRRSYARLRSSVPVQLITTSRHFMGVIEDLSVRGARVGAIDPPWTGREILLRWADHEAFGFVVWTEAKSFGVVFDKPIPNALVIEFCNLPMDTPVKTDRSI